MKQPVHAEYHLIRAVWQISLKESEGGLSFYFENYFDVPLYFSRSAVSALKLNYKGKALSCGLGRIDFTGKEAIFYLKTSMFELFFSYLKDCPRIAFSKRKVKGPLSLLFFF